MRFSLPWLLALSAAATAAHAADAPPKTDAFADGVHHYQNGADRTEYPRYTPDQVDEIAGNILLFQRDNGGWSANWDPLRILSQDEKDQLAKQHDDLDTTLDNRATYPQAEYLAEAFNRTGNTAYRDAALRGIEFLLTAQHPCGGWPHSYPDTNNYRPHVTFMDDVTIGALTTIRKVSLAAAPWAFAPEELRNRAKAATARGDACLLKLQVVVNGAPTVWAGQYDEHTLQPCQARTFELPSLVSAESVNIVRYLMDIDPPTPEIIRAIEGAIHWYESAKITGLRIDRVKIDRVRFPNHTATEDVVAIADPNAPLTWARFYEIDTNRPFMANRDGKKVYTLAEVQEERRTGYGWYTGAPAPLLHTEYPAWQKHFANLLPASP